ncbi:MAG TPA: hypothetical protein VFX87_10145 [Methylomirabilota bacterium]|nr:hypothetical protein [Methylomirabilota bacterium]
MSARVSSSGLARLLAGAALVAGLAAMGAGVAPAGERRAGSVLAVDAEARTLTLDEFGANADRRALRVQVPREAVVLLSQRNQAGRDAKDSFRDSTIALADVRVGDFVVIEMSGDPEVARLVMITLRRGAGS